VPIQSKMSTRVHSRGSLSADGGFLILEVIVSAAILLMVSLATFAALDKSDALAGNQERRTTAANLAQSELERVRSLPALDVANLRPGGSGKSTQTLNGITYTISTTTKWLTDGKTESDCTSSNGGMDYLQASTSVSWPLMGNAKPVTMSALITPTAGTGADQTTGSFSAQIVDRDSNGIAGLPLTLLGDQNFTDPTNVNGCVTWGLLPVANTWELKASIGGFVDVDGNPTIDDTNIGLTGGGVVKRQYMYDHAGWTQANIETIDNYGNVVASPAQTTLQIANPGMSGGIAKAVALSLPTAPPGSAGVWDGSPSGTPLNLFPFAAPDELYVGTCTADEPQAPASPVYVNIPRNGVKPAGNVLAPAQQPTVKNSAGTVAVAGAKVVVTDACGTSYTRYTNSVAQLDDPGFPYFQTGYLCASSGGHYISIATTNIKQTGQTTNILKIPAVGNSGPKSC